MRLSNIRHPKRLAALGASVVAVAAAFVTLPTVAASAGSGGGWVAARAATSQYHDLSVAEADGYQVLKDENGVECIDDPGVGTMGIHYVNGTFVGNAKEAIKRPEAVIYEPEKNGHMTLVAVEYVVLQSAWEQAGHTGPPSLFGQAFMLTTAPNRFGLPAFYSLHAWLWRQNPLGRFSPWNPRVNCHGHG